MVHQPTDGGVGRHVVDLCAGLSDRGYEVLTCGPIPPAGTSSSHSHFFLDLERAVAPRADASCVVRFVSILRRAQPDIVHAHSSKAGAVARLARLLRPRVPVIYSPHGYAFAGYFTSHLERLAYREAERALAPLASKVVCVCEAEAMLARSIGSDRRVRVVYNGIEPPLRGSVNARMRSIASKGPVVCALTLLRPGKGVETLIDATPAILARHPHAQIAIWGEGPERTELERRASVRGVRQAVHLLGPTTEPLAVLAGADVFVLSSWAESFPYVMLEAMSIGAPIVASDVGGISEAVRDGDEGLLVPPRDPNALGCSIARVLDDSALRQRIGEAARHRAAGQFSSRRMIDGTARVYAEVHLPD